MNTEFEPDATAQQSENESIISSLSAFLGKLATTSHKCYSWTVSISWIDYRCIIRGMLTVRVCALTVVSWRGEVCVSFPHSFVVASYS